MKTIKQIKRELQAINVQRAKLDVLKKPLEKLMYELEAQERVKKSKYKPGQRVEYRLGGCKVVQFGVIAAVNARAWNDVTYLVERVDKDGNKVGFGNEVQEREIFGSSHK